MDHGHNRPSIDTLVRIRDRLIRLSVWHQPEEFHNQVAALDREVTRQQRSVSSLRPELLLAGYGEQGEWARHYNAARMTVASIMLAGGLVVMGMGIDAKRWELLAGAAFLFVAMAGLVFALTRLMYKHIGHQILVEAEAPPLADGKKRSPERLHTKGFDPASSLTLVVAALMCGLVWCAWLNAGADEKPLAAAAGKEDARPRGGVEGGTGESPIE